MSIIVRAFVIESVVIVSEARRRSRCYRFNASDLKELAEGLFIGMQRPSLQRLVCR
jgi:hypothetical protein